MSQDSRLEASGHLSQYAVGKAMIGGEVKVCSEEHGYRHIIEAMCWHGVFRLENRIEI
jgi:hypothetical protein